MLWPYYWQAERAAVAGTGGPGNNPYAAAYVGLTNEWRFGESLASDNMVDSIGSVTLTQSGNPGTLNGSRVFSVAGSKQGVAVATNGLAGIGGDFSGSVVWQKGVFPGTNETVFCVRSYPASDANLTWLLRYSGGSHDLELLIGDGVGGLFTATIAAAFNDTATKHWFAWSFNATTKEIRSSLDGAAVVSNTSTVKPTTLPATPKIGVGGFGGEYLNGSVFRARIWQGLKVSDNVLRVLDYLDPRGV